MGTYLGTNKVNLRGGITMSITGIDTSDATATADDIAYTKTAYVKGEKITGTLSTYGEAAITNFTELEDHPSSNCIYAYGKNSGKKILSDACVVKTKIPYSEFGNATADDVISGKTFTSESGLKVTGTITSQGAQTITPGTSDKTIASGKYLSAVIVKVVVSKILIFIGYIYIWAAGLYSGLRAAVNDKTSCCTIIDSYSQPRVYSSQAR